MKLKLLLGDLDKSAENECQIDMTDFADYEFGLDLYDAKENDKLKCYYVANSYCTDTIVGIKAFFYKESSTVDDTLVAISRKPSRGSKELVYWTSLNLKNKVAEYCKSLITIHCHLSQFNELDLEQEMGVGYRVEYASNFLTDRVLYNVEGKYKFVSIIRRFQYIDEFTKTDFTDLCEMYGILPNAVFPHHFIRILLPNGDTRVVRAKDVSIPYNTLSNKVQR